MGAGLSNPFGIVPNAASNPYPHGYVDIAGLYVQTIVLAASGVFNNQSISIDSDSDFVWRAVTFTAVDGSSFSVRFIDSSGSYLSNDFVPSAFFGFDTQNPYPIVNERIFPAGSRIALDVNNTGGPITIQIQYQGVRRYRLPAGYQTFS